jgi:hypothetical protein
MHPLREIVLGASVDDREAAGEDGPSVAIDRESVAFGN